MMHGDEKSDPAIVAIRTNADGIRREKPANEGGQLPEELVDPRGGRGERDRARHATDTEPAADRLSLHRSASQLDPGKTRLIEFGRHAAKNRRVSGLGKPETFDFPARITQRCNTQAVVRPIGPRGLKV
jgi:hypothetical protein